MSSFRNKPVREKVFLNVYDLHESNAFAGAFGLGAYHSGVEYAGSEYTFGTGGIVTHAPRGAEMQSTSETGAQGYCKFKQQVELGECDLPPSKIRDELLPKLEREMGFVGNNYNLYKKNCNNFSDELSKLMLKSSKSVVPGWVNRAASLGGKFGMGGSGQQSDQQQQVEDEQSKPHYTAFAGQGRALGTPSTNAAASSSAQQQQDHGGSGGGFFSRIFGRSSSSAAASSKKQGEAAAPAAQKNQDSAASAGPVETPEQRRQRQLQAIEARMHR